MARGSVVKRGNDFSIVYYVDGAQHHKIVQEISLR